MEDSAPDYILEKCNFEKYHCDTLPQVPERVVLSRGPVVFLVRSSVPFTHCFYHTADPDVFRSQRWCNKNAQSHFQLLDYPCWVLISVSSRDDVRWIPVLFLPGLGGEMCVVSLLWYCPSIVPIEGAAQKISDHVHITFITGLVPWYLVTIVFV